MPSGRVGNNPGQMTVLNSNQGSRVEPVIVGEILILITGIVLWVLGAVQLANPQMVLAGKCIVGVSATLLSFPLAAICYLFLVEKKVL